MPLGRLKDQEIKFRSEKWSALAEWSKPRSNDNQNEDPSVDVKYIHENVAMWDDHPWPIILF